MVPSMIPKIMEGNSFTIYANVTGNPIGIPVEYCENISQVLTCQQFERHEMCIRDRTYLTENYPDIPLQKYDSYATAKNALENGNGVAWANDNTEVIAFALQNKGYTVGISELGNKDTIAPAVSKGNDTLLDWVNEEIKSLGDEPLFHKDYEETLVDLSLIHIFFCWFQCRSSDCRRIHSGARSFPGRTLYICNGTRTD